jgi:hypothetical protein
VDVANALVQFNEVRDRYLMAVKTLGKQMQTEMAPAFQVIFDKYPQLESVEWTQYTPYFNDGDTCEFGVHEPRIFFDGEEYDYGPWDKKDKDLPWAKCYKEVEAFVQGIPEEVMLQVFGDHMKISVDRIKPNVVAITSDEYSHE